MKTPPARENLILDTYDECHSIRLTAFHCKCGRETVRRILQKRRAQEALRNSDLYYYSLLEVILFAILIALILTIIPLSIYLFFAYVS